MVSTSWTVRSSKRPSTVASSGSGFTLVELMLCLALLCIMALAAIPSSSSALDMQLIGARDRLQADLEYARSRSMTHGRPFYVVFDTQNNVYRITDSADGQVIRHPVNGSVYRMQLAKGTFSRVCLGTVSFDGNSDIGFDRLGAPVTQGIPLQDNGFITLTMGSETSTFSVIPVTGVIEIQ